LACYTGIRRHQCLIPSIPSAPSSASPTTRETHLAKKCLPMRLPISTHGLNPLKKSGLKPHDYEFHIPGADASPGWAASAGPGKPAPGPRLPAPDPRPPAPGPWPLVTAPP
jgi:hypothetical protein